jgi:hypothetical protein
MVAAALGIYTFYLTAHQQIGNTALFLVLCPPSIAAIGLDNAGVLGGIIGWLFISTANATLYGVIGFAFGAVAQKPK